MDTNLVLGGLGQSNDWPNRHAAPLTCVPQTREVTELRVWLIHVGESTLGRCKPSSRFPYIWSYIVVWPCLMHVRVWIEVCRWMLYMFVLTSVQEYVWKRIKKWQNIHVYAIPLIDSRVVHIRMAITSVPSEIDVAESWMCEDRGVCDRLLDCWDVVDGTHSTHSPWLQSPSVSNSRR